MGKRLWLGLALMLVLMLIGSSLVSAMRFQSWPVESAVRIVVNFGCVFAGGYVARRGFLIPAVLVCVLSIGFVTYTLASLGGPNGPYLAVFRYNAVTNFLDLFATVVAAFAGMAMGRRSVGTVAATT